MAATKKDRQHRATFATDKRNGGYLIRVAGPYANRFNGRDVPVTRKDGSETTVTLERVIWAGKDRESGEPVALYTFVRQEIEEDIPF